MINVIAARNKITFPFARLRSLLYWLGFKQAILNCSNQLIFSDLSINDYYRKVKELRAKNHITLPVILKNERQINVFLRTEDIDLINVINEETLLQQPEERFAWLRSKKDRF